MKSIDVEQQFLYSLLTNGELIKQCKLTPNDFASVIHAQIYDAAIQCEKNNEPVDPVTVSLELERRQHIQDMNYFSELVDKAVGSAKNFDAYQRKIREAARNREAKKIAVSLQYQLDEDDPNIAVSNAIRDLMALDDTKRTFDCHIKRAVEESCQAIDATQGTDGLIGIPTGLSELDRCLGGFHDTDLIVIASRPAMGKTAFMLSSAHAANAPCGIISAEQSATQVAMRLLSIEGSINSQNLRCAKLSDHEWKRLSESAIELSGRNVWINDQPAIDITDLVRQARQWKYHNDIKILYVDYLQKIRGSNLRAPRWEQVTEIVQTLKNLARELSIPVFVLAQVKREVDTRADKRPRMGDISDASEVEKEADVIATLYRDVEQEPNVAEVLIEKNRHGDTGLVMTQYIGKYFQFKDRALLS